uniref:C2 n=1 Tax=Turnip leaf roll virus TaxID=1766828 RepID=A0A0S3JNX2_9GEMI|nr:C2 [Turnip leaf roll virus]
MKPLNPGRYKIQPSPLSRSLSTITKIAKKPKTIHLPCKCKFTIHHGCGEGFTHRGTYNASSINDWDLHTSNQEPLLPQAHIMGPPRERVVQHQNTTPLQLQPKETTGDTPMLDRVHGVGASPEFDWTAFYNDFLEETQPLP